jgi:protein involved in polysaccharide export with SLBB domain
MHQPQQSIAWIVLLSVFFMQVRPMHLAYAARPNRVAVESASEPMDTGPGDSSSSTELAPGFLIQLSSSRDTKLNGTYRVQPNGKIDLPYSVTLDTQGMNLGRFRAGIAQAYRRYFKGVPNVHAHIKQKRYWVEVLGLVARPGDYLVKEDSPLDEIISLAGGSTEDLNSGFVRIVQDKKVSWIDLTEYYKGHITDTPHWHGADRIFFQKERPEMGPDPLDAETSRKVQVLGEVRNPGELTYRKEADVYYYLVKTGGPTSNSDLDKVEIVRADHDTGVRKQVSLSQLGEVKNVQGGDILIFHTQRPSSFEKTLAITSIITSILTTTVLAIIAIRSNK